MTVTSIRQIHNATGIDVEVLSHESKQSVKLSGGGSAGTDMWIPWCVNQSDFEWGHYIEVLIPGSVWNPLPTRLFVLWQKDNQVCFSNNRWQLNGQCVPTNCATGGNRLLAIEGNIGADPQGTAAIKVTNLK